MAKSVTVGNPTNKTVPTIIAGTAGGNKTVREGWIGTGSGNAQFFAGLSASDTGNAVSAVDGTFAPDGGSTIVTPADGAGGNTIAWARTGGDTEPVISSATSFSVNWTVPSNPAGYSATWQYTVTDAHGIGTTGSISVSFPSSA